MLAVRIEDVRGLGPVSAGKKLVETVLDVCWREYHPPIPTRLEGWHTAIHAGTDRLDLAAAVAGLNHWFGSGLTPHPLPAWAPVDVAHACHRYLHEQGMLVTLLRLDGDVAFGPHGQVFYMPAARRDISQVTVPRVFAGWMDEALAQLQAAGTRTGALPALPTCHGWSQHG